MSSMERFVLVRCLSIHCLDYFEFSLRKIVLLSGCAFIVLIFLFPIFVEYLRTRSKIHLKIQFQSENNKFCLFCRRFFFFLLLFVRVENKHFANFQ